VEEVLDELEAVRRTVSLLEDGDLALVIAVDVPGVLGVLAEMGATA
jgi:hypothetical protein